MTREIVETRDIGPLNPTCAKDGHAEIDAADMKDGDGPWLMMIMCTRCTKVLRVEKCTPEESTERDAWAIQADAQMAEEAAERAGTEAL